MDNIDIYCPKCQWEPAEDSEWMCECGHVWNTFDTGGRCPSCKKVWDHTQCIGPEGGCDQWSPHLDWYHGLEEIVRKLKEEILEDWGVEVLVPAEVGERYLDK
ncbi:hypothetical protein [Aridibaculum aurantiacum]|uniref:hypothetical protein n=1 Tax=Aridibaculum aurantiacum TaxID=2810307 RepID=UPI001A95DF92|nr:hypothetical protein [Aridibaculum aurantiacum]